MTRSSLRNLATAAALILMISLTGCILVFTVVGSDVYEVNSNDGVTNGPIAVDVTVKGFWPVWPETLNATVWGTVDPVGSPSDALDAEDIVIANMIEDNLYDQFSGSNQFDSVTAENVETDDVFRVSVVMPIPGLKELASQGGATSSLAFTDVSLLDLLKAERYNEMVANLQNACANIPTGNSVRTTLEGSLTKGSKLIGDFEVTIILHGSQILP